ncbi:hypothetical protein PLICRDRAFT_442985 [Plicaturopsis crispa FD-325 SS-3]|uniref:DUF6534 domain-containing protein n=1 Tax=Plicaturopsis crispa FD-325 SS-3 TaxID=944288 RepID=A0A0C9T3G3_PLICR|nr:hypothetical protein PLICRDRAFT_442985 [Plicaturopsis crispa FD-325 SS-3]
MLPSLSNSINVFPVRFGSRSPWTQLDGRKALSIRFAQLLCLGRPPAPVINSSSSRYKYHRAVLFISTHPAHTVMSTSTASANLDTSLGAVVIGALVCLSLSGTVNAQAYTYFRRFSKDEVWLKISVGILWICELVYTGLVSGTLYFMTVKSFGQPQKFTQPPATLYVCMVFGSSLANMSQVSHIATCATLFSSRIQAFFARRIWQMSGKPDIAVVCCVLSAANLSMSIFVTVGDFQAMSTWNEYIKHKLPWFITWLSVGSATDLIITVKLSSLLYKERSRSAKRTVAVIDKMLVWCVQTGVITSLSSIAVLVVLVTVPDNYAWLAILTCLPQLFLSSLLASLNARATFRRGLEGAVVMQPVCFPDVRSSGGGPQSTHTRGSDHSVETKPQTVNRLPVEF